MKYHRGSSLIESLIGLVIFMVAGLGWISIESMMTKTTGETHLTSVAAAVAQSKAEALRQLNFAALTGEGVEFYDEEGNQLTGTVIDHTFDLLYQVEEVTTYTFPVKRVTIEVTWDFDPEYDNYVQLIFERSQ